MSLLVASLNSGSNGNCYYVGNDKEAVLVDAGISCREIERRMKRLGLAIENVKALFVSHEHSDHIRGIPSLLKKFRLPVYITAPTLKSGGLYMDKSLVRTFSHEEPVLIGDLKVKAFPKFHDAADPYSFVVECRMVKVGVFTDIGTPCDQLKHHFTQCHAAFLESNYDEGMLEKGNYPYFLKKRIRDGQGHLSNRQALELFLQYRPPFMTHLFLSHLSNNNNRPELVEELFLPHAGNTRIVVASRHQESAVYQVNHSLSSIEIPRFEREVSQLALAF
jgi:phosphoribosyl 1,2-cyclic phosphodiesterase